MADEVGTLDVRCLPYMPLQIERLRRSKAWLRCKRRPELAFYIMNLWMRSWHELPAGSLEDDDDVLADAAMCSPEEWERVRADVLAGWELRDGRYHHPVVIEIATEGASKLRKNASRTAAAREAAARVREQSQGGDDPSPGSGTETVTETVTEDVTGDEGKGREENKSSEATASGAAAPQLELVAANDPADPSEAERELFIRGKRVLGEKAGGVIANLLKSRGGNVALARAVIEEASQKQAGMEWVQAAIRRGGPGPPSRGPSYGSIAFDHDAQVRSFLDDRDSEDPQVEIIPPGRRLA